MVEIYFEIEYFDSYLSTVQKLAWAFNPCIFLNVFKNNENINEFNNGVLLE
jgi:hypothetical protein